MYKGQCRQGGEIILGVLCTDASGAAAAPDTAPLAEVWTAMSAKALARTIPSMDSGRQTGLFSYRLFLGRGFEAGQYRVVYRYKVAGTSFVAEDAFTVLPGGDPDGAVISMTQYVRPGARWIVQQLESGANVAGKNPFI